VEIRRCEKVAYLAVWLHECFPRKDEGVKDEWGE
jgi:hypothetical protein